MNKVINKLLSINQNKMSLKSRAIRTSAQQFTGTMLLNFLKLGSNLVMTRILVPEDFGLIALIFTIHTGLVLLSDVGIKTSIIRSENGEQPVFIRTAWTMQVIQFSGLASILLLLSIAIWFLHSTGIFINSNTVYGDERLPLLLAGSVGMVLMQGLMPTKIALAERKMLIKKIIIIDVISQIVGSSAMISIALLYPTAWALILGATLSIAAKLILSFMLLPGPKMGFMLEQRYVSEIWHFGKWLIGSSTFGFIANNADKFILGALLNSTLFGVYAISLIWIEAIVKVVRKVVNSTVLPVLNETRLKNSERLYDVFARIRHILAVCCLILTACIIFLAVPFATFFYEGQFEETGSLLVLLSLKILLLQILPFNGLLLTLGKSKLLALTSISKAFFAVLLPFCAVYFIGWQDGAIILAFSSVFGFFSVWYYLRKVLNVKLISELSIIIPQVILWFLLVSLELNYFV